MSGLSESSASVVTAFRCDGCVSETWPPPLMCDSRSPTSLTLTVILGSRLSDHSDGRRKKSQYIELIELIELVELVELVEMVDRNLQHKYNWQ